MSALTYGQLIRGSAPADAAAGPSVPSPPSWHTVAHLLVVVLGASLGGLAAQALLDDPGVQATVVNAATGSAGAVLATLTAYLFVRRMHRTLALEDVVLSGALTLLAGANALGAVVTSANATHTAVAMSVGLVVSVGLLAWAIAPMRTLETTARADVAFGVVLGVGVLLAVGSAAVVQVTGLIVDAGGFSAVTVVDALTSLGAATAAVALVRGSTSSRDPVTLWLAAGAAVVAVAHASNGALTWSSDRVLSGGDIVLVAGWFALLVAGIRDFEWAHRRRAEDAVMDERRRLALDLHDGLAQELAYITAESRRLAGKSGEHLAQAAERALEESRAAILALTRPADEPLERTIAVAAQSIGARAGVDVTVAVRPGLDAAANVRTMLLRILREAMTNAVRHGGANTVHVSLDGPSPLVMAVADDGAGFDLSAPRRPDSLGLISMQERAANLGGSLSIESIEGEGTTVAMVLP